MKRISPTILEIDLNALRFNYRQLRKRLPAPVEAACVVKSNAYGHGAGRVARVLQEEGADAFGVGTVDEGIELREAGIKKPIWILLGLIDGQFESVVRYQLTPVLYDLKVAHGLNQFLIRSRSHFKVPYPVHVKVDTGMTRLGVLPKGLAAFCDRLKNLSHLKAQGLLTHLAEAGDEAFTKGQVKAFQVAQEVFQKKFPEASVFHLANSQAAIDRVPSPCVRLGIALYGVYPLERDHRYLTLKPVLKWKTRIVSVKKIPAKTPVSYNRTYVTKRESRIGVLPVGYADGYFRCLSNQSRVLVRGREVRVVGTICMDMMMIDLTPVPNARVGDEAVLIGRQGSLEIRADDLARLSHTIPYEVFCRIAERIPRHYVSH